jgi:hypothetical protein
MSDRSQHCASLLTVIFFKIRVVIPKFRFTRGFGKANFHCVGQISLQMANLDILDLDVTPVMCVERSNNRMSDLLFPSIQ